MTDVQFKINEKKKGSFFIEDEGRRIAEMIINMTGDIMIVEHTEVTPEMEGKGLAKQLVNAMADYVRTKELKVVPLCPYTLAVFKKDPEKYKDIWYKRGLN